MTTVQFGKNKNSVPMYAVSYFRLDIPTFCENSGNNRNPVYPYFR